MAQSSAVEDALKDALALFSKGHALDHFNWAASSLTAADVKELNELPGTLRRALAAIRLAATQHP